MNTEVGCHPLVLWAFVYYRSAIGGRERVVLTQ